MTHTKTHSIRSFAIAHARIPGQNGRYVESFVVESWFEHLRQHERATVGDRTVHERIRRFHIAGAWPSVTHLIAATFVTRS